MMVIKLVRYYKHLWQYSTLIKYYIEGAFTMLKHANSIEKL